MKKIAAIALTAIAVSLVSCGPSYTPELLSGYLMSQIATWINFQSKYATTNAKVGTDAEISYSFNKDAEKILDSYVKREISINGNMATLTFTIKKAIGDCKNGVWTTIYNAGNPANPIRVVVEGENCLPLTPNVCNYASSRQCGMEEVAVAKDPAEEAKAELEAAANKWIKETPDYSASSYSTQTFTFAKEGEEVRIWRATSKVKIGDCPAKSVWELWAEGDACGNNPPKNKKCSSITPKVITDYKGDSGC
ncbi:MAG: hypothetical protein FWF67_04765 [Fibromonadales bacterium]|nr:hypothetical protein [Fibromonadales bacterium]